MLAISVVYHTHPEDDIFWTKNDDIMVTTSMNVLFSR
jgi:hypothetical protein